MIFANLIGKFACLKNLVTRGALYETNTGERQFSQSFVTELFGHTLQGSGRRLIGVANTGVPGIIFPTDFITVGVGETGLIQLFSGVAIDTGVPGPPNIIHLEATVADPVTGDIEKQVGTAFFYRKNGLTGAETIEISPTNGGRFFGSNLPIYADEAAATLGGETTGAIYQTATGELRIKL